MSKLENVLYIPYFYLKSKVTLLMKLFKDNGIVRFSEELILQVGDGFISLLNLLNLLRKLRKPPAVSDLDMPDPNEDEPGPEGGDPEPGPEGGDPPPGPNGDDSEPEDNNNNKKLDKGKGRAITPEEISEDNNNKKLDKGKGRAITPEEMSEENEYYQSKKLDKGKAKAIWPEEIPEERKESFTDYNEKIFQNDLERAKLNSLEESTKGESSRQGATLQERGDEEARVASLRKLMGESSTQGGSLGQNESAETQNESAETQNESAETQKEVEVSYDHYCAVAESRRATVRNFNDINMKLTSKDDNLSPEQRQFLLEESVQLKEDVGKYDLYIDSLKKLLNIPPEDQGYYPNNSSEESESEYSSSEEEEESRPHKRPKK